MTARWSNWAGNQECAPAAFAMPASQDEIVRVVKEAADAGRRVRVAGAGHSFTDAVITDGTLVSLDNYQRVLDVDMATRRVTVEAGIRLADLSRELAARGLALPNLGDIAYQSVAGATSTATHGTGTKLGNLSTQIVAMELVTGDGSVVRAALDEDPDTLAAARVGIGALGIVSTVTLQCVPAFTLHAVEQPERLDGLLEKLDEEADANEHFEFFWIPHTGWALTKRNNRTDRPPTDRGRWASWRDDILFQNIVFGALCRVGRVRPSLIPRLNRALPSASSRMEYVERSDKVFASPRLVHFVEMEYAIPREAAADTIRELRSWLHASGLRISFPVEVRFVAADDILLSPATGRATCYLAVHVYRGMPHEQYFRGVERIMDAVGGRPHWGKMHYQTAATLAPKYPDTWDRFQTVRRRFDPEGRFANSYTDRVLGSGR